MKTEHLEHKFKSIATKLHAISHMSHMGCGGKEYSLFVLDEKECKYVKDITKEHKIISEVANEMIDLVKEKFSLKYIHRWIDDNVISAMRKKEKITQATIKGKLFELKKIYDDWQRESAYILPVTGLKVQQGKQEKIAGVTFWDSEDFTIYAKEKKYDTEISSEYKVFAEFRHVGEIQKTREIAQDKIFKILEILQIFNFSNRYLKDVPEIKIGGYEQIYKQHNFSEINGEIYGGAKITKSPLTINLPIEKYIHISEKIFDILDCGSQKGINDSIFKGIHWHALGERSTDREIALVYFVMSLEVLLGNKGNGGIQHHIAEALAFILGEKLDKRKKISTSFKDIYNKRSNIAHGFKNNSKISINDIETARYFSLETIKFLVQKRDEIKTKDDLISYLEKLKFGVI